MKILTSILIITAFTASCHAVEQAKITLNENNMSSTGGGALEEAISIKFSRGMFNDDPISNEEKITAMQSLIRYYQFLEKNKIDLSKQITATYTQKPLIEVIKDLMPNVDVKFDGVDPTIKVGSYKITNASLKKVLEHLDRASGVYLNYSKTGVLVTSKPK